MNLHEYQLIQSLVQLNNPQHFSNLKTGSFDCIIQQIKIKPWVRKTFTLRPCSLLGAGSEPNFDSGTGYLHSTRKIQLYRQSIQQECNSRPIRFQKYNSMSNKNWATGLFTGPFYPSISGESLPYWSTFFQPIIGKHMVTSRLTDQTNPKLTVGQQELGLHWGQWMRHLLM